LQGLMATVDVHHLAVTDGSAITELTRPVTKLVPPVAGRMWIGPLWHPVSRHHLRELLRRGEIRWQSQQCRYLIGYRKSPR
jgi:hypothetical protein